MNEAKTEGLDDHPRKMTGSRMKATVQKVKRTIFTYRMITPGDRVIVAVSGGPDSVCLLDILNEVKDELNIELVTAHFDHGLRPGEDEAETGFVKALSGSYGLPFETGKATALSPDLPSLEEKARQARYRFLTRVKARRMARRIAVGHHLNDQAETVLMRLLRGSGPSGLSGIPPVRDGMIVRPLIGLRRDEILSYLQARGLSYMVDPSNFKTCHLRNRIRLELIPLLKSFQPRLEEILGQAADTMRVDEEWFSQCAEGWVRREKKEGADGGIRVSLDRFSALPPPLKIRVVRVLLKEAGENLRRISRRHLESVIRLASSDRPQGELHLPYGLVVKKMYDSLSFTHAREEACPDFLFHLDSPGLWRLDKIGCSVLLEEMEEIDFDEISRDPRTVFLDAEKLTFPLVLRNFRPGDRMVPLGMQGQKKLKDLFIELKIPLEKRRRIPILTNLDGPVWVCGLRIDDRYRITGSTHKVLRVSIEVDEKDETVVHSGTLGSCVAELRERRSKGGKD